MLLLSAGCGQAGAEYCACLYMHVLFTLYTCITLGEIWKRLWASYDNRHM